MNKILSLSKHQLPLCSVDDLSSVVQFLTTDIMYNPLILIGSEGRISNADESRHVEVSKHHSHQDYVCVCIFVCVHVFVHQSCGGVNESMLQIILSKVWLDA